MAAASCSGTPARTWQGGLTLNLTITENELGRCGQNGVPAFVENNPIFKVIEELPSAQG